MTGGKSIDEEMLPESQGTVIDNPRKNGEVNPSLNARIDDSIWFYNHKQS